MSSVVLNPATSYTHPDVYDYLVKRLKTKQLPHMALWK